MKFLKYVLYIILGLVLLFFAIGLLKPSVAYGHEITVNKSAKETWAIAQDESKFPQWLEGFKSIERISGEHGEVGSTYKVIVDPGNGQPDFEMIETIVSIKEFDHIEMNFVSDMMDFNQIVTHKESNGKTTVKTESTVNGKGIMMRAMFAIMETLGGNFTAQETKNIEALKKVIEENTTDYYPAPVLPDAEEVMSSEEEK